MKLGTVARNLALFCSIWLAAGYLEGQERINTPMSQPVFYRTAKVDGLSIFYREAGPKDAPTLLLLHGLPSSSRMFEPLLPGFLIAITCWRPTTQASDTATGQTRKNSRTRSIISPTS